MASFKEGMRAHVAGSMNDRGGPGEAGRFTVNRSSVERQAEGRKRLDAACVIRVDRIVPDPGQPRSEFDAEALERLAASLRERGQLQPIRVRWDEPADRYVIVVGERRYRAAKLAGLETLACVVVHVNRRGRTCSRTNWSRTRCARTSSRSSRPGPTRRSWPPAACPTASWPTGSRSATPP